MKNQSCFPLRIGPRLLLAAAVLAGCASQAPSPGPVSGSTPATRAAAPAPPPLERHYVELAPGLSIDYQVERKLSAVNATSCYALFTGTLANDSRETLSRRTVLDFNVFSAGRQVFRDLSSPVADLPPGRRVAFQMVVSPLHRDGCIPYDRIVVSLRKVLAN